MKVKKVLSLALAIVMIFTMIPAQLILSNANKSGRPSGEIGEAVKYNTDVTLEKDGDYAGLVKVAFQASVKYPETLTTTEQKSIITLEDIVCVDTTVLEPVDYDGVNSILDTVKTNAGSAPAYSWVVNPDETDIALFAEDVTVIQRNKPVQKQYGLALSALSYNNDNLYVHFVAQQSPSGYVWGVEDEFCTIAYMYFKLADGKELTDVPAAVRNSTEDDLGSDTACRARSFMSENYVSTGPEPNMFCPNMSATYADDFDPAPQPTKVKVTFNWKAVEEGAVVDKTTGEVEYEPGADLTVPANSEDDYSTNEYDYEFTGWSPEVPATVPETPATQTYTAQYQKKAVDTDALAAAYNEDKGLVQEDYDELVPGAWNALQEALADAKTVLEKDEPNKVEVADALAAIESAMQNLSKKTTPSTNFNITFVWQGGAKSETVETAPNAQPQLPQGAEDEYYSADGRTKYTFNGWKAETGTVYGDASRLPEATADATYTAQYESEPVIVKITFNWANAEGPQTATVDKTYGDEVTAQDAPVVSDYFSADGDTKYIFQGWTPDFVAATEAKTYTANFKSEAQYAKYDSVEAAMLIANAKMAEDEYDAKYTDASKQALKDAINAVQWEPKLPLSQQTTVDDWAADIEAKANALALKDVTFTFFTHDNPEGIERSYKYGDPVNNVPTVEPYTDDANFTWTFDKWNKTVPTVAKTTDMFTAEYKREDAASTADLQTAVNNAIAKRDDGNWTDTSKANLNAVLDEAAPYLEQGAEFPASQQGAINDLRDRVNAAADALTPAGATEFDVTFNWKVDGGENANDTTKWSNGQTPTAPTGSENGYETTDYTYTFMRWEPSIVAVDGANQVYNAVYNDPQPKRADTSALEQAIADAQAKMAETDYQAKYTEGTRTALEGALATGQQVLDSSPLPSQKGTVDTATQAINDALSGMQRNQFTLKFYTHEHPEGIEQLKYYGDAITPPEFGAYSDGDYDYTPKTGADAWSPVVPETATTEEEYTAQYTKVGPIGAIYDDNTAAVTAADDVLNTPNADKIYTEEYLQGIQNALQQNVDQGLGRSQQGVVDEATQRITGALANPQYKTYTIRFLDDDGTTVLATDSTYKYNDEVTAPANPTKEATVDKTFTFKEWTPAVTAVTGDQDYVASYNSAPRKYTVTYVYHDGQATEAVEYGKLPQTPPTVPTYYEHGIKYTFDYWTPEFGPVEGPGQTYTAVYSQEQMPAVTVTFKYALSVEDVKDGKLTEVQQQVPYGDMPVEPTVKSFKDGDTTYKFDGWDKTIVAATEEATYTAIYTPVTEFVPDMTEINALVSRYNQMVKTGKYNKADLKLVKAYIDEIYDTTFTSQDEVNEMAAHLKALEDACRRIDGKKESKEEIEKRKESYNRRYSRTARTGDNATLVVMSVILVSSIGIAVISLKKRRENI